MPFAYHAINLIKKYFNCNELKGLLTSNYYSTLYYNSEIWHLPTLSPHLKQKWGQSYTVGPILYDVKIETSNKG